MAARQNHSVTMWENLCQARLEAVDAAVTNLFSSPTYALSRVDTLLWEPTKRASCFPLGFARPCLSVRARVYVSVCVCAFIYIIECLFISACLYACVLSIL